MKFLCDGVDVGLYAWAALVVLPAKYIKGSISRRSMLELQQWLKVGPEHA